MIPIISLSNIIIFLFSAAITFYLWRAYQKSKDKLLKNFLYFFICVTGFSFSITAPFLIFNNFLLINLAVMSTPAFLYLALGFISIISLRIIRWQKVEKIYLIVLLLFLIFSYLMIFIHFEPVEIGYTENFVYWYVPPSRTLWQIGSVAQGIISGITLLSVAIFFFIGGFKSEEKFIRKRAFLMGSGMLFLTIAGIVNYIAGGVPNLPAYISASILAILSLLLLFSGIVIVKSEVSNQ